MVTRLDGKTVLVLNGDERQGAAIVRTISNAGGVAVIGAGLRTVPADRNIYTVPFDLSLAENWPWALEAVEAEVGPLSGLVCHNHAIAAASIDELDRAESRAIRAATLDVTMLAMRETLPRLRHRAGSAIVVVSSIAGEVGFPAHAMACSVAMAQRAMARSAAMHAREKRYTTRINVILAGIMPHSPMALDMSRATVSPDAIAEMAAFLLSEAAMQITGAEFTVDNGGSVYPA